MLGLFALILGCGILFFLFNSGQILRERALATNAADAAAYSAGITMARVMNFEAYTNRAVMANVVAIGQMTAIASWGRYVGHGIGTSYSNKDPDPADLCVHFCLTEEGDTAVALTYAGNAVLEAYTGIDIFEYWRAAQRYVEAGLSVMTGLSDAALHEVLQPPGVKDVLLATLPLARQRAIQDVVDRNYDGYGSARATGIVVQDTFFAFEGGGPMIRRHGGGDRERLRATAEAAAFRDPFVEARRWERDSLLPTCVDHRGVHHDELRRGGGTRLGLDEWEAIDTSSWHEKTMRKGRCRRNEQPFGYGSADVGEDPGLSTRDMGGSGRNPDAADQAEGEASATVGGFTGLPSFFELSAAALAAERPVARFAVRVNRAGGDLRVTGRAAETQAAGRFELMGDGDGRSMAAVAAVEVFFERLTPREDGHDELASLFNPFWHARLVAPSEAAIAETVLSQ